MTSDHSPGKDAKDAGLGHPPRMQNQKSQFGRIRGPPSDLSPRFLVLVEYPLSMKPIKKLMKGSLLLQGQWMRRKRAFPLLNQHLFPGRDDDHKGSMQTRNRISRELLSHLF